MPEGLVKRRCLAAALAATAAAHAEAAAVAPHRALYDIRMEQARQESSLRAIDGRMGFELSEAGCEGWTVSFRMANRYLPDEGHSRVVDTQSTSFETRDATRLDYAEKEFVNDKLENESRLEVRRDAATADGAGAIKLPQAATFTLAAGTLFPMQHQLHLMDLADAGVSRDSSVVFDGSDGVNAMQAVSFIGKARAAGQPVRDADAAAARTLQPLRSWPVTVSYFDQHGDNPDTPSYAVSFDLYENGVAAGLHMDYGTFRLAGTLKSLEMLPKEACN